MGSEFVQCYCVEKMIVFIASVHRFAVVYEVHDENAPTERSTLYLNWMLQNTTSIFFFHLFCFLWNNNPVWIFLPTFWGGYFSAGLSSSYPMEASGSLVKTKQRQECWWGLHLYPGLFFLLCYTPGIFKKAPVWWKLLAALWMCAESTRLLLGLPNFLKCQCSRSHSSQLSFCHLFSPNPSCALPDTKKKRIDEEAVFVHAFTQVATISHALCSEIEIGI